jgi:hypothetical protein
VASTCAFIHSFEPHCPHMSYVHSGGTPSVDDSVLAANTTNGGFSPIDEQALQNHTLTPATTPQTTNSLGLAIDGNDIGYVAVVQIGTPPRNFNILMDSGSADFWVGAEACVSENGGDCVSPSFIQSILAILILPRCVGEPRVSRTRILIFLRGHTDPIPRNLWLWSCVGRCHHRQRRRCWTAAF